MPSGTGEATPPHFLSHVTHTHTYIWWRWHLWSLTEDDHKSQLYEWLCWTLQTVDRIALTFKTTQYKNTGFQLPESVDWFASCGCWKPLTVRVRLVSVYKSHCSLSSWQEEIWQTILFTFKTLKIYIFDCSFLFLPEYSIFCMNISESLKSKQKEEALEQLAYNM